MHTSELGYKHITKTFILLKDIFEKLEYPLKDQSVLLVHIITIATTAEILKILRNKFKISQ